MGYSYLGQYRDGRYAIRLLRPYLLRCLKVLRGEYVKIIG